MEIDREKAIKLVIVVLATLAALAVMSTMVQLIQTVLPFLIVGAGIYAGYRWVLSDAPAPTADEMEEQARGIFSRFRRGKKAVEASINAGAALGDLSDLGEKVKSPEETEKQEKKERAAKPAPPDKVSQQKATASETSESEEGNEGAVAAAKQDEAGRKKQIRQVKRALGSKSDGAIEFKDSDVVISKDDLVQPDISRLEEKEKEVPKVNDSVMTQIEERRRRLQDGE